MTVFYRHTPGPGNRLIQSSSQLQNLHHIRHCIQTFIMTVYLDSSSSTFIVSVAVCIHLGSYHILITSVTNNYRHSSRHSLYIDIHHVSKYTQTFIMHERLSKVTGHSSRMAMNHLISTVTKHASFINHIYSCLTTTKQALLAVTAILFPLTTYLFLITAAGVWDFHFR